MPVRISVLGSTGSIGRSTLNVIREHPDQFQLVALGAGTNAEEMIKQVIEFQPKVVAMASKEAAEQVKKEIPSQIPVLVGREGITEIATLEEVTYVVSAIVGSQGLPPTLAAIRAGKTIGLANKETLVTAGHIVMEEARKHQVDLIPIDSEHSAIFQCLNGENKKEVSRLILTGSGGAFRDWSRDQLKNATVEEALNHPNFSMGPKITIDSATMMNKGLEVIEAHWLFGFPYDQIDVVIHPQQIIHSMVEYRDGSIMAQLGIPDMRVPIQYALSYPRRLPMTDSKLDLSSLSRLDFRIIDFERYPCVRLAYEAGHQGGTYPTVLNAANEEAVAQFLMGQIPFIVIEELVEQALAKHQVVDSPSLEEIDLADQWARGFVKNLVNRKVAERY